MMTHDKPRLLSAVTSRRHKAVNAFKEMLRLNSGNSYALIGLGMLYPDMKRFTEARSVPEPSLKADPHDIKALYHLAIACAQPKQGSRAIAIKLLEKEHKIIPLNPVISNDLREPGGVNEQ